MIKQVSLITKQSSYLIFNREINYMTSSFFLLQCLCKEVALCVLGNTEWQPTVISCFDFSQFQVPVFESQVVLLRTGILIQIIRIVNQSNGVITFKFSNKKFAKKNKFNVFQTIASFDRFNQDNQKIIGQSNQLLNYLSLNWQTKRPRSSPTSPAQTHGLGNNMRMSGLFVINSSLPGTQSPLHDRSVTFSVRRTEN